MSPKRKPETPTPIVPNPRASWKDNPHGVGSSDVDMGIAVLVQSPPLSLSQGWKIQRAVCMSGANKERSIIYQYS